MSKIKIKDIIMIILSSIMFFAIDYCFLLVFGGALLSVLGLKYSSIASLAKFIAIYMIIALPVEFIIYSFFRIVREVKNISNLEYNAILFFADVPTSMVLMGIVEFFMKDISCSMLTAFLFSVVCFFVNMLLDMKSNKDELTNEDENDKAA